jgi:hypothetical protein
MPRKGEGDTAGLVGRTSNVQGLGVVAIVTTNIDREILAAMKVAAAKERRFTISVLCEAALEWLADHDHDLPDGYELVEAETT